MLNSGILIKTFEKNFLETGNLIAFYSFSNPSGNVVFNDLYTSISQVTNVDDIGGIADINIPKTRGAGGEQSVTRSSSSNITSRTNTNSSLSVEDLNNNPEALDSLAKLLFLADFLSEGGAGINGLAAAWASLPITRRESYKKQILEEAE